MKKRDWIVIGFVLMMALGLGFFALRDMKPGQILRITMKGEIYGEYSLMQNQKIEIGDSNVCVIEDGKVRMIDANCPDQVCVHTAAISSEGMTIVCLPNRIVLEIFDKLAEEDLSDEKIDGVSS